MKCVMLGAAVVVMGAGRERVRRPCGDGDATRGDIATASDGGVTDATTGDPATRGGRTVA